MPRSKLSPSRAELLRWLEEDEYLLSTIGSGRITMGQARYRALCRAHALQQLLGGTRRDDGKRARPFLVK